MNNALATRAEITEQRTRLLIASTILEQLGGRANRFAVMTGARDFVALESGVQFAIGKGAKAGINKVRILLTPADTYTVEFWKIRGADATLVSTTDDVYCDSLSRVFEQATGFSTTL